MENNSGRDIFSSQNDTANNDPASDLDKIFGIQSTQKKGYSEEELMSEMESIFQSGYEAADKKETAVEPASESNPFALNETVHSETTADVLPEAEPAITDEHEVKPAPVDADVQANTVSDQKEGSGTETESMKEQPADEGTEPDAGSGQRTGTDSKAEPEPGKDGFPDMESESESEEEYETESEDDLDIPVSGYAAVLAAGKPQRQGSDFETVSENAAEKTQEPEAVSEPSSAVADEPSIEVLPPVDKEYMERLDAALDEVPDEEYLRAQKTAALKEEAAAKGRTTGIIAGAAGLAAGTAAGASFEEKKSGPGTDNTDNHRGTENKQASDKHEKKKHRGRIAVIIVLACCAALFGIYAFLCNKGQTRDIDTQYVINGINITAMSEAEAKEALNKQFEEEYSDSQYLVKVEDKNFTIPVYSYLAIDAEKGIEEAASQEVGPWITRGLKYIQSKINSVEYVETKVEPYLAEKDQLLADVMKIEDSIEKAPVDAKWDEKDGIVSITTGKKGNSVDAKKIGEDIAASIEKGQFSGSVSAPLIVKEPKGVDVDEIVNTVHKDAENAGYKLENNELVITESKTGKEVSKEEIEEKLASADEGITITVKENDIQPQVTEDYLRQILLADKISGYMVVNGGSETQINNQSLACEAVNGKIILPGEIFSFNELVGDTTEEKGYVEDYAYENNRLVTQVGGGVCRVASTLYAAVLYTNLEVVERHNHTSPVHYLPYGMDATVSYPEPDLKFMNNREYPIQIFMYMGDDGYVHAEIYGTHIENEPYVEVMLDFETEMLVHTWRYYYTEENGDLINTEFMHTSSYVDLIPDETPTPAPSPENDQPQPEPQPEPQPTEEPTPEPQPTEEPTPEPEEGGGEEGGDEEGGEDEGGEEGGGE